MVDDPNKSRRAIDLHSAEVLGRFDERLQQIKDDVGDLKQIVNGPPGEPGLAEQVRRIMWIAGGFVVIMSWLPWLYDHFLTKSAKAPIFGEELREKWVKESTKRIRIFDKRTGTWEYFYAVEDKKQSPSEAERENP